MLPNTSLHPTRYSGLRPLPRAGELKRWADGSQLDARPRDRTYRTAAAGVVRGNAFHRIADPTQVDLLHSKPRRPGAAPNPDDRVRRPRLHHRGGVRRQQLPLHRRRMRSLRLALHHLRRVRRRRLYHRRRVRREHLALHHRRRMWRSRRHRRRVRRPPAPPLAVSAALRPLPRLLWTTLTRHRPRHRRRVRRAHARPSAASRTLAHRRTSTMTARVYLHPLHRAKLPRLWPSGPRRVDRHAARCAIRVRIDRSWL